MGPAKQPVPDSSVPMTKKRCDVCLVTETGGTRAVGVFWTIGLRLIGERVRRASCTCCLVYSSCNSCSTAKGLSLREGKGRYRLDAVAGALENLLCTDTAETIAIQHGWKQSKLYRENRGFCCRLTQLCRPRRFDRGLYAVLYTHTGSTTNNQWCGCIHMPASTSMYVLMRSCCQKSQVLCATTDP
jgi:hypothetical protein